VQVPRRLEDRAGPLGGLEPAGLHPPDAAAASRPVRLTEGVNLLELAPVRLAAWEESGDDRVVVMRPPPAARGLAGLFIRFGNWLAPPRLRLDPIGSRAWRALDGARTVASVAAELRERFGEAAEPAEERLGKLLRLLRRDGFLALPPYDEVAAPAASAATASGSTR